MFGAGALGSVFGAILSKNNDVVLITRGEHLRAIQEKGLKITGKTQGVFKIDAVPEYPGGSDVIILTVKAYQTDEAVRDIMKEYSDEIVITFQNGVGLVEKLRQFDVIGGITTHGATKIEPGVVHHAGTGDTCIGELNGVITERVLKIAENFTGCGLVTQPVANIMERRWIKAAINACINPLTALLRVKNGALMNHELAEIMKCIADECAQILAEKGINADVYSLALDVVKKTAENQSSMLQDILYGKRTEVDYIVKPFIKGKCNRTLYHLIKFLENQRGEGDLNPRGQRPTA